MESESDISCVGPKKSDSVLLHQEVVSRFFSFLILSKMFNYMQEYIKKLETLLLVSAAFLERFLTYLIF